MIPSEVETELCQAIGCESLDESVKALIPPAIGMFSKLSGPALVVALLSGMRFEPKVAEPMEPDQTEEATGEQTTNQPTEADYIRTAVMEHPEATNAEIIKLVTEHGVTVTSSQVSAIKKKLKQ